MPGVIYWGAGGQFGPFDSQDDGWPNAGQVMRYFREKSGMTAKAFGKLYGKEVRENGKPICERWILEMELENKVPTDITRRRVIARLLSIPSVLFGLASLEDIVVQPQKEEVKPLASPAIVQQETLQKVSTDITRYEKNIRLALQLHRTSNAQGILQDINANISDLVHLESRARGDFLYQVRELLVSNTLLATKIVKDQGQFALASMYANHAVDVAKNLDDDELIATAKYTRGCAQLEWGIFGFVKQGSLRIDQGKVRSALLDFQDILTQIKKQHVALHPQLQGLTMLQLSRAEGVFKRIVPDSKTAHVLSLADQVEDMVGRNPIDDPQMRMLLTGTLSGLHLGGYHLIKAGIFNEVGFPGKAIAELKQLKRLTEQTYGQDETRNQAWSDITLSEAYLGLKEYDEAVMKAKEALVACYHINSRQNVTLITDIYQRVLRSSYGKSEDVRELGDMLTGWFG